MRRALRWAPWVGVAACLVVLACDAPARPDRVWAEDFEQECDGAPCGWQRASGTDDQARWVSTIHPGEHALRLSGEVSVRGPGSGLAGRRITSQGVAVQAVARCDAGAILEIELVIAENAATRNARARINPGDDWRRVTEEGLDFDAPVNDGRITAVVIRKSGAGTCELGELAIDDRPLDVTGC